MNIAQVLYLVVVLASPGQRDKIFSEPLTENITLQQCAAQSIMVMPRIQQQTEYKGYDLKSFGCLTENQVSKLFDEVRRR